MAFTDFLHLVADFVTGQKYTIRQIERTHRALDTVAKNAGSPFGVGIFKRPSSSAFAVTAGAGLVLNVAGGVASLSYSTGTVIVSNAPDSFSLLNYTNRGDDNPVFVHIAASKGVLTGDGTPKDDVMEVGRASYALLDTQTSPGYIALAKVTTSATQILSVTDLRAASFLSFEVPATTTTLGLVRLSVAAVNAASPIALAPNDPLADAHARPELLTLGDNDEFATWNAATSTYSRTKRANVFKNFFTALASKGALYVGKGDGTVGVLVAGMDGSALIADSTASLGYRFGNPVPAAHTHTANDITDFDARARAAMEYATGAPVADLNALRAVPAANRSDNQGRYVDSEDALFFYAEDGTGADDGTGTIAPSDNVGRWFRRSGGGTGNAETIQGRDLSYILNRANATGTQDAATTLTGLGNAAFATIGQTGGVMSYDDPTRTDARFPSNDAALAHTAPSGDLASNRYASSYLNARNLMVGKMMYDSSRDNALFQAAKRFTVSCLDNDAPAAFAFNDLFTNSFPTGYAFNAAHTFKISIDFTGKGEYGANGVAQSDGNLYLTFYQNLAPQSISARVRDATNVWRPCGGTTLLQSNARGQLWGLAMASSQNMVELEVTIVAQSNAMCWLCELEWHKFSFGTNNFDTPDALPDITHDTVQRMYNDFEFRNDNNEVTIKFNRQTGVITGTVSQNLPLLDFGMNTFTFDKAGLCGISCNVHNLGEFEGVYKTYTESSGGCYIWEDKVRSSETNLAFVILLLPGNTYPFQLTVHFSARGAFAPVPNPTSPNYGSSAVIPFGSGGTTPLATPDNSTQTGTQGSVTGTDKRNLNAISGAPRVTGEVGNLTRRAAFYDQDKNFLGYVALYDEVGQLYNQTQNQMQTQNGGTVLEGG